SPRHRTSSMAQDERAGHASRLVVLAEGLDWTGVEDDEDQVVRSAAAVIDIGTDGRDRHVVGRLALVGDADRGLTAGLYRHGVRPKLEVDRIRPVASRRASAAACADRPA